MKCRKHPFDQSSAVGVCAPCLRERLAFLIAAQAEAEAEAEAHAPAAADRRKPDPQPPPPQHLVFPRSVSPYISRRKSDAVGGHGHGQPHHHHHLFYRTPQVGPAYKYSDAAGGFVASESESEPRKKKKKRGKFSLFAGLFGKSRSERFDPESDARLYCDWDASLSRLHRDSSRATPPSSSWLSFLSRRGKCRPRGCAAAAEDSVSAFESRRPRPARDRGMSPERGEESDDEDRSPPPPLGSGYASESSHGRPRGTTPVRPRTGAHSRTVSGLSFCLSPLVRPSPARQWSHLKCGFQPDARYAGDIIRVLPGHPHLSAAASYRGNRSRKLTDFGRVNPNS